MYLKLVGVGSLTVLSVAEKYRPWHPAPLNFLILTLLCVEVSLARSAAFSTLRYTVSARDAASPGAAKPVMSSSRGVSLPGFIVTVAPMSVPLRSRLAVQPSGNSRTSCPHCPRLSARGLAAAECDTSRRRGRTDLSDGRRIVILEIPVNGDSERKSNQSACVFLMYPSILRPRSPIELSIPKKPIAQCDCPHVFPDLPALDPPRLSPAICGSRTAPTLISDK